LDFHPVEEESATFATTEELIAEKRFPPCGEK
jgi:hypothetical protein